MKFRNVLKQITTFLIVLAILPIGQMTAFSSEMELYDNLYVSDLTTNPDGRWNIFNTSRDTYTKDAVESTDRNGDSGTFVKYTHTVTKAAETYIMGAMANSSSMMPCFAEKKLPLKYGKTYYFSTWMKTNRAADIKSMFPYWYLYTNQTGFAEVYKNNCIIPLQDTEEWQFVEGVFTVNSAGLAAAEKAGETPLEFYFSFMNTNQVTVDEENPFWIMLDDWSLQEVAFGLTASADSITTEGGTVTITTTPVTDVYYVTDNVNAALSVSGNTATLTGKINGDITITAIDKSDTTKKISKTITISGQSEKIPATKYKLGAVGNSILSHSPSADMGWYGYWGMAASSQDKDYIHRLEYYLTEKYGQGNIEYVPGAKLPGFEVAAKDNLADYSTYYAAVVEDVRLKQYDIFTIQLGENADATMSAETWANAVGQLVGSLKEASPDTLFVITTPFWGGANLIAGAELVSEKYNVPIAYLHTLNSDENMAKDKFEHIGVGMHPGDTGMDNIAKLFFEQINIKMSGTENTLYTTIPTSVEITTADTQITAIEGTLQLSAKVLPEGAGEGILWSVDKESFATISEDGLLTAKNNGTVTVKATSRYNKEAFAEKTITISGQTPAHTLTYDKNTTDTVANMPESDNYAKGNCKFADVYPERDTYKFCGWALTPDGRPVSSVNVTKDTTVYAVWEIASSWSFDMDGYAERFVTENMFHQNVTDGALTGLATGTNAAGGNVLKITSPLLNLDDSYDTLVIRMKNSISATDTTLDLTVIAGGEEYDFSQPVVHGDYKTYTFDISEVTGTITGFSFIPTNMDCSVWVDEIVIAKDSVIAYDKNTTDEVANMPDDGYMYVLADAIPVRTGYNFLGWSLEPDSKLLIDEVPEKNGNYTLYAVWDKIKLGDNLYVSGLTEATSVVGGGWNLYATSTNNYDKEAVTSTDRDGNDGSFIKYTHKVSIPTRNFVVSAKNAVKQSVYEHKLPFENGKTYYFSAYVKTNRAADVKSLSPHWFLYTGQGGAFGAEYPSCSMPLADTDDWQAIGCTFTVNSDALAAAEAASETPLEYYFSLLNGGTIAVDENNPFWIMLDDWSLQEVPSGDEASEEGNVVVAADTIKSISSGSSTYIVKKGGTLKPIGKTAVKALSLSGDVDMTEGYLMVDETVEIAENVNYSVFTLDKELFNVMSGNSMYLGNTDTAVEMVNGGTYIVKLDEIGEGFVYFKNSDNVIVKTVSVDRGVMKASSTKENAVEVMSGGIKNGAAVFVAAYDGNGRLLRAFSKEYDLKKGTNEFTIDDIVGVEGAEIIDSAQNVRIMLLDSFDALKPFAPTMNHK